MSDYSSTDLAGAAHYGRMDDAWWEPPSPADWAGLEDDDPDSIPVAEKQKTGETDG